MARLLWEHQGQVIKDQPFSKGSVTIGRRRDNSIVFTNPEVSSSHARIDKVGADYILTDLQSTNGTFVNGLKVLSHRLSHGDRISIGKNILLFIGTEKATADAERANIPLDRTVIIGGSKHRKRPHAPTLTTEKPSAEPIPPRYHLKADPIPPRHHLKAIVVGFVVMGALVVLGVFAVKDSAFLLRGIMPKADQGKGPEGTTVPAPAETGGASQEGEVSSSARPEGPRSPAQIEKNGDIGDSEGPAVSIEAIVWSSDARKSFVLINGAEFRVGDSIDGKTLARIERDHVVLQSQEGKSIVRLKFK